MTTIALPQEWESPPVEFSLAPFWFWNDELDERELSRQLDEFQAHGVSAFVIHPRVGLPRDMGWMSPALLDKMRFVIEQAKARGMWIILYDEGMYPSGSSSGQVVAENPAYQCRGLVRINLDTAVPNSSEQGIHIKEDGQISLASDQTLVATVRYNGQRYAIVDRPIDSVIRGLHYIDENALDALTGEVSEDSPLATDLLNPDAVACFIRLVYERYYSEFGDYFGNLIPAIFTDEPMLLGRPRERGIVPGTVGILEHVNQFLGYDFTPYLPALFDADCPFHIRYDYERAIENRLEKTYYTQLYDWCETHNIALTGHPALPDATRHLKYFHIPGQDIVWRDIEADKPSALESKQSTQAKAASSAMLHYGRRRNGNEFCGAYGFELTFEEMRWLANWLLVRGCNLLIPHAFYYSVRGARKNERPPDVGLNSGWWDDDFTRFAQGSSRLCWLNTDSELICHVAILGEHHNLPLHAAKACYQNQIDFNYLDANDLFNSSKIADETIQISNQTYSALIVDGDLSPSTEKKLERLSGKIPIVYWNEDTSACLVDLKSLIPHDIHISPVYHGLRVRHVQKGGLDWYILFNEVAEAIDLTIHLSLRGDVVVINPYTNETSNFTGRLSFAEHEVKLIAISSNS